MSGPVNTDPEPEFMQPAAASPHPERHRTYLLALAHTHIFATGRLRHKLNASDIVQDALLKAHASLPEFQGGTEDELKAWLRVILANKLADAVRHLTRQKRDAGLEESLRETLDDSAARMTRLAAKQTSPSQFVLRRERETIIADALAELPEDQATAVRLRYLAGYSPAEIAQAMERTQPAVAGLLRRGLKDLRERLRHLE